MGIVVPRRQPGAVPTEALPNFRHSADEFASPHSVDLAGFRREANDFAEQERSKADDVAILDADNQLSESAIALQSDALKMQGKDALGALSHVQDKWQQTTSDIESKLTNDRQKLRFRERAQGRWAQLHETVQQHTDAEYQKYDVSTTDAALQLRLNDAVTHYTDPGAVAHAADETTATIADFGARHGLSPEVIQRQTAAAVSKLHVSVIDRMLDNKQDLAAKTYYGQVKDRITGPDAGPIEERLKVGSVRGESQRQADKILADTDNMSEAVAKARAIEDPEVRDAVEQRVRSDFSERAEALRARREQLMTDASNIIDRTGDINSIPTSQWASMTIGEKNTLREYAKKRNDPAGVKTDLPTFYNLETMATTPETRDKFLGLDLNEYKAKLSPSDFEEMAKLQGSVRKGDAAAEAKLQWTQSKNQIVGSVMNGALIGINRRGKKTDEQIRSEFRSAVDNEVERIQSTTNKPVTPADVKQIANELATRHVVDRPGALFGLFGDSHPAVPLFQMEKGEKIVLTIKDVPAAQRQQIIQSLQSRGRPVTNAAVVDWYRRYIQSRIPEPQ